MYHLEGIREGVLVLPTGRKVPLSIDGVRYSPGEIPDIHVSIMGGGRGHFMIDEYERMVRAKNFLAKPFVLPPTNPTIKNVIFNDPATIVIWSDDTKTVVKCQEGDTYDKELGLSLCISKKYFGNKGNFNEVFKKWIPEEDKKETVTAYDVDGNIVITFNTDDIACKEMIKAIRNYCKCHCCDDCPIYALPGRKTGFCSHHISKEILTENYNAIKDLV